MTLTKTSLRTVTLVSALAILASCGQRDRSAPRPDPQALECMTRAMYFESNRSSRDGMIGVGTVGMNRVAPDDFPDTVCGVVSA